MTTHAANEPDVPGSATALKPGGAGRRLLEITGIAKSFGGVRALTDASLSLDLGTVHAVIGHNGAGKSTIMRILSGVTRPDMGSIVLDGEEVTFRHPRDAQGRGISMVHQELSVLDDLDIAENIFLTREPLTRAGLIDRKEMDRMARAVLLDLGLDRPVRMKCGALSIGERQMVEIARAVSFDARVLILDEPTAALTRREQEALFALLGRLKQQVGIFYISHRLDEVIQLADVVTILRDGWTVGRLDRGDFDHGDLVEQMLGRTLEESALVVHTGGETLLSVSGLKSKAGGLNGVDFRLRRGEIVGLAGMLGSGRSELFECLFGMRKFETGRVELAGHVIRPRSAVEAMALGIALVPEDRKMQGIFAGAPLWNNITLASLRDLFSRFGLVNRGRARRAASTQVERMGIRARSIDQDIRMLSGGNQQKVVLARWILREPCLLLLDDPTAGVDVGAKAEVHGQVRALAAQGVGIVIASSEFDELIGLCHRVLVMRDGRIIDDVDGALANAQALVMTATGAAA